MMAALNQAKSFGDTKCPKTMIEAHNVLEQHTWDPAYKEKKNKLKKQGSGSGNNAQGNTENPSLSFAQLKQGKCYCCGKSNHSYQDCTKRTQLPKDKWWINKQSGVQQYNEVIAEIANHMQTEFNTSSNASTATSTTADTADDSATNRPEQTWQSFIFSGLQEYNSMKDTMLLDSGSSVDLFCNENWLTNVGQASRPTLLRTNGGNINVTRQGTLPSYGTVPLDDKAMTNILSLGVVTDKYKVTMDTSKENAILVHTPQKVVKFARNDANLYVHVPSNLPKSSISRNTGVSKPKKQVSFGPGTFVQTVEENKLFYTPREIKKAKMARDLLAALGSPSIADLKKAITMNAINNLPVKTEDIDTAERIYGPDLGTLKGKTTRRKPIPMVTDTIAMPQELYEDRSDWELCMDIMFVNGMPFLTSITRKLYYRTAQFLPSRGRDDLYKGLDTIFRLYNHNGFVINRVYADNEFRTLMDDVKDELDVEMIYSPAQAHVPEAERNNRVLKERIRATYHRLPYKALPIKVMKMLVMESAKKLNFFPNKCGISQYYSPRQIVHREALDYDRHCRYPIGQYVQAHDNPNPTNTQAARTIDALYLRPGNQSGHQVLDISTNQIIDRSYVTPLPVTPAVIAAVEAIAAARTSKVSV